MGHAKCSDLRLHEVTFATEGPRRRTRPNFSSVGINKHLQQLLRWMLEFGEPDPGKWYKSHLANAAPYSIEHTSEAATEFFALLAVIAPELSQTELAMIRTDAINCYARDRHFKALLLRYPNWRPEFEVKGDVPNTGTQFENQPNIFWTDNTVFAPIVGRMALHHIGIRSTQFSDHVHGDGYTLLGKLTLQRTIFALENRYTASRIISGPTTHLAAMRKLAKLAKTGASIFMNNNAFIGRRFACTRLNEELSFVQATAPLTMTRVYNAIIVPMTVLEVIPFQRFSIEFHEPIRADHSLCKDDDLKRMAMLSVRRQLASIREHPEQWLCWTSGQLAQPTNGKLHRPAM